MIDLTLGSSSGGGSTGNASVMGLASRLLFDWKFARRSTGIESMPGPTPFLPFVAKKTRIHKDDIINAAAKVTDDRIVANGRLDVIRNSGIVRQFPWSFTGAGQLSPPAVAASISLNPAAGNPGFPRVAGTNYEFTAAYVDSVGKTPASTFTLAAVSANSTIGNIVNHVFKTRRVRVGEGSGGDLSNRNMDITGLWKTDGPINTSVAFPTVTISPYDSGSGKEVLPLVAPAKNPNSFAGYIGDYSVNAAPGGFSGSAGNWSVGCEVCYGVHIGNNTAVRTSPIATIPSSGGKRFYPSHGWGTYYEDEVNNRYARSRLDGKEQLLTSVADPNSFLTAYGILLWRPVGQTTWSMAVDFTGNNFPIASEYRIPNQSAFGGGGITLLESLPGGVTSVDTVNIGYVVNSESLGDVNTGCSNVNVYMVDGTGVSHQMLGQPPTSAVLFYHRGRNVLNANGTNSGFTLLETGAGATAITTPSGYKYVPCGMISFQKLPDLNDFTRSPEGSPKGDQFFTAGERVRVNLSVPPSARSTGVEWYMRTVVKNVSGSLSYTPWGRMSGSGYTNQYVTTVTPNATLPTANTTANVLGNADGKVDWNDAISEYFDLEVGDIVQMAGVTFVQTSGGGPTRFPVHQQNNFPGDWLTISFEIELLE